MSRKNIIVASLLTATFTAGILISTLQPATTEISKAPAQPVPQVEKTMKVNALNQDVNASDHLNRLDAGKHLQNFLSNVRKSSSQDISLYANRLQQEHGHITMLMWIDFSTNKTMTFKSSSFPEGSAQEQKQLQQYLKSAKSAVKGHQSYESPTFTIGKEKYYLIAQRDQNRQNGVIALMNQKILSRVADHQLKNLRLIPYPKEGKYHVESVHTDNLRDITVKTGHDNENASHYYENEIVVRFPKGHPTSAQLKAISQDIHCNSPRKLGYAYIFRSSDMNYMRLKSYFSNKWHPLYSEPHYLYLTNDVANEQAGGNFAPNDQLFSTYQWNLPAIETEMGWRLSKGSKDVIIAVIDTGVQANHPDLAGNLLPGYNSITNGSTPNDDVGHGTHVSGIIGALVNNSEGVAGISWYNKILPVKALDNSGAGTTYSVAEGIIWAADNGAKVINLSLGNYAESQFLHDAIKYAYDRDIVIVSAAGNDNTERPGFPAAYPEVMAVAATNSFAEKASFSNFGDYIDVTAPGESIASTYPDSQYAALSGTSMASPHVAALAGLVRSLNPELSNTEVMKLMTDHCIDLGTPGHDKYYGWGQVDIYKTLQAAGGQDVPLQLWPQHVRQQLDNLIRQSDKIGK